MMMRRQGQAGLSIVELMVALAIGAFLVLGVVNVLMSNKRSSQIETSLARLQENGRTALDLLVTDIQDTMYIGCKSSISSLSVMASAVTWTGLQGYERASGGWTPALPTALSGLAAVARVGSDLVNLQHARPLGLALSAPIVPTDTSLSVASNPGCVSKDDLVVVSSCVTSHLFRVTNDPACDGTATTFAYASSGNASTSMEPGYDTDDMLMGFFDKTWYVADTGRRRTDLNIPVYAMFRRANGVTEEMIEGVEYLEITYGQELADGNIRYVAADDTTLDLDDVVSLRVALLVQSFEPVLKENDTGVYQLLDESIGATGTLTHNGDRTLRRVFRTTVLLRNRAQGA